MLLAGFALIVGGIAIVAAGSMARSGRLSRQAVVGIRTRTTMASDESWRVAHEAGGAWIVVGGAIMAFGGVLTVLTDSDDTAAAVSLGTAFVSVVFILIGGFRGQAAARDV